MRKFLALALAVAMVLSLAAVSFAADVEFDTKSEIKLTPFYKYDGDVNEIQNAQAQYGKSYYAMIFEGKWTNTDDGDGKVEAGEKQTITYAPIKDYKQVEKMKIKVDYEMGEDLVESISIVKKLYDGVEDTVKQYGTTTDAADLSQTIKDYATLTETSVASGTTPNIVWNSDSTDAITAPVAGKYYYFVEIKTKEQRVTGDADVIGTLEFNRKKKDDVAEVDEVEVDFTTNLFYEKAYMDKDGNATEYTVEGNQDIELKWDKLYVLKYKCDDEVTFTFGEGDLNEGEFTVDVSGQGKMVIDFDTKANEAIVAANPGVKMFFVNFNGAKFNRTGEFEYEMENMVSAYQVVDDQLVEIKGLEISGDTATFATRALGNYVFADAEIVNPVAAVEAPAVEAPAVTNPSTGAAA